MNKYVIALEDKFGQNIKLYWEKNVDGDFDLIWNFTKKIGSFSCTSDDKFCQMSCAVDLFNEIQGVK